MRLYISFGGSTYDSTVQEVVNSYQRLGVDNVWFYDDLWLECQEFYHVNKKFWDHPQKRGFGWYCWKPYIILNALGKASAGDVVLYSDADTYPIGDLTPLYEIAERDGIMLFAASNWNNRQWCKRDCYIVMNQDEEKYHNAQAGVARFMLFQKGPWKPYQFLLEWLAYTVNPLCNTFDKSVLGPELDGFIEHRCEQSVLTLLAHRYGYKLYREACQAGEGFSQDKEIYPTVFHQEPTKTYLNITAPVEGSRYRNV